MEINLSDTPSILFRDGHRCYSNNGSVIYGFHVHLREIYSNSEKDFDTIHHMENALKARTLFLKDKDYIIRDDQVVIVDEFTGRLMPGRRSSYTCPIPTPLAH